MKKDIALRCSAVEKIKMNVIICDDEKSTCAELENVILDYASKKVIQITVEVFYSGETLMDYLGRENKPDIIFLDIELPGIDGIGVGRFIRDELENNQMCIVYISSKEQYALALFQNRPFEFLIKPLRGDEIVKVLNNIIKMISKEKNYFEFQNKATLHRIPYNEILYFQSTGKRINIVMLKETQSFYGKLSQIKLYDHYFLEIHKSFLINYNCVSEYTYESVKMINGDILNISKANRAAVRKRILEREQDGLEDF